MHPRGVWGAVAGHGRMVSSTRVPEDENAGGPVGSAGVVVWLPRGRGDARLPLLASLGAGSVGDGDPACRAVHSNSSSEGDHKLRVGVAQVDVEHDHGVGGVLLECS